MRYGLVIVGYNAFDIMFTVTFFETKQAAEDELNKICEASPERKQSIQATHRVASEREIEKAMIDIPQATWRLLN